MHYSMWADAGTDCCVIAAAHTQRRVLWLGYQQHVLLSGVSWCSNGLHR